MTVADSVKPSGSSSEGERQKHLNREVRDMVSTITHRLTNIHKLGSVQAGQEDLDEDDNGTRIVTLAGTNTGATLRGELDEKSSGLCGDQPVLGDSDALRTYINSNFQAINNSIMMGGSYNTNDPGVHVEISDFAHPDKESKAEKKRGRKGKKNKEASKSDGTSESEN